MATMEQARDVEVDRALVEIRQRLQQMDAKPAEHMWRSEEITQMVRQTTLQGRQASAALLLAGAAIGGLIVHFLKI
jgi:hypothetical protein